MEYLNWSAKHYDDSRFLETYQHRAAHMLKLHGDHLLPTTARRLQSLL